MAEGAREARDWRFLLAQPVKATESKDSSVSPLAPAHAPLSPGGASEASSDLGRYMIPSQAAILAKMTKFS